MANRDTWTVTAVGRRGELLVTASTAAGARRHRDITPVHKSEVLPADYVAEQTELAYASTVYGVQARPSPAHVVLGDPTGAASAYVGMTHGRAAHIAHLVAPTWPRPGSS